MKLDCTKIVITQEIKCIIADTWMGLHTDCFLFTS